MVVGRRYYVYLMTNKNHSVLYTGVTNDLARRVHEHKHKMAPGFTASYLLDRLVFFEVSQDIESALAREKQIKAGSRQKKIDLVHQANREWRDLSEDW